MADTTTTPARTITGTINIQQNGLLDVVTGQDAKFTLYVQSTVDLNGKELKVQLGTGADCAAATTVVSRNISSLRLERTRIV